MDLKSASIHELRAELDTRLKEAQREAERKRALDELRWFSNIDALVSAADHTRNACSDERPYNDGRCVRCTLIAMQKAGDWDSAYTLSISLSGI